jgi:hypothetical protein
MTLKHKTQSSDLALSDYQLLPGLKQNLPVTKKLNRHDRRADYRGNGILPTEDKHISRYSKYVSRDED